MEIERIKFATSVQVNFTEKLFVDADKEHCQITFVPEHGYYMIRDKNERLIIVHATNVQWAVPRTQSEESYAGQSGHTRSRRPRAAAASEI